MRQRPARHRHDKKIIETKQYQLPRTSVPTRWTTSTICSYAPRDLYFKVSSKLWTSGEFQQLTAPGLAMLLILLEEGGFRPSESPFLKTVRPQGREVWFTTENFPARFGISAAMRSRGTKELEKAFLLSTKRRPVGPPGTLVSFTTEKLRKVYTLQGNAVVEDKETEAKRAKASGKKLAAKVSPVANDESKTQPPKRGK